jgi:hypothetical protein
LDRARDTVKGPWPSPDEYAVLAKLTGYRYGADATSEYRQARHRRVLLQMSARGSSCGLAADRAEVEAWRRRCGDFESGGVGELAEQFGAPVSAAHGVVFDAAGVESPAAGGGQDLCVRVPFGRCGDGGGAEGGRDLVVAVGVASGAGEGGNREQGAGWLCAWMVSNAAVRSASVCR